MRLDDIEIKEIPIFPLPNVVFFPKTLLPLHVFEPRYRQMVQDALSGHNQIGMVLLQDGWEQDYFGSPPVHDVGCIGDIQLSEKLKDGKYNVVLYGITRARIMEFVQLEPYRIARVKPLKDQSFDPDQTNLDDEFEALLSLTRTYLKKLGVKNLKGLLTLQNYSFESLVNQVASIVDMPMDDKQELLELDSLESRYARLSGFVENRIFSLRIGDKIKYVPEDPRLN